MQTTPYFHKKALITLIVFLFLSATAITCYYFYCDTYHPLLLAEDEDGVWRASEEVNLFGKEPLAPGATGDYRFAILAPGRADYTYTIYLNFEYTDGGIAPPLTYTLKADSDSLSFTDTSAGEMRELTITDLDLTLRQRSDMHLVWRWDFTGDHDDYDTLVGHIGGIYRCTLTIEARKK